MDEDEYRSAKRLKDDDVSSRSSFDLDEQVDRLVNEPDASETDAEGDLAVDLADLAQDYEKEDDLGPKVSENLANLINVMMKGAISEEKLEQKFSKLKRPENCNLFVPKVNAEIWNILDHSAKTDDLRTQRVQKMLLKAVNSLTMISETCLASKDASAKAACKGMLGAIGLVLKANRDISQDRRAKILVSNRINRQFRKLLSPDIPVTENLFGDDLKSVCATIESTSKLGRSFLVSPKGRKFFPRPRSSDPQVFPRGRGQIRYQPRGKRGHPRARGRGAYYKRDQRQ